MKLFCKGEYHNQPTQLHFAGPGVIEIDTWKGEFLLRDAPENFERYVEPAATIETFESAPAVGVGDTNDFADKGLDGPTKDKQMKAAPRKK